MKIRANGKIIFETFIHDIYEMDVTESRDSFDLKACRIGKDDLDKVGTAIGNTTRRWIKEDYPYVEGYCFINDKDEQVGSCWVMYKGGDEKLYKIRKHDSFIFRLEVDPQYRGKGYAKQIMRIMTDIIAAKGCRDMCLVCAVKNRIAAGLYQSLGMKKAGRRMFVRLGNRNIPYYSL